MSIHRESPLNIGSEEFRRTGHKLIDSIADFFDSIQNNPVTTGETPLQIQKVVGSYSLPQNPANTEEILSRASDLLFRHSLINGHPKFLGYITSSPAPIGALADLLAAAVNPNVGANILSPVATEIEKQAISWLVEFIGLPSSYGGIFVSGGNMANFTGFLAGITSKGPAEIKENGISNDSQKLVVYCSSSTHTWIEKAAKLFGLGTKSIHWIQADVRNRMDIELLEETVKNDVKNGCTPLMIVANAGDVSTGAIDNLSSIAAVCKKYNMWFHVDGAYGLPAIILPEFRDFFDGIDEADSIAIDPHKWLYSPLEAGCALVKDPNNLVKAFSAHPAYYNFGNDDSIVNFYEYGLQNSRGFRALKVWIILQQAGLNGFRRMIEQDVYLSRLLYEKSKDNPELEVVTQNLSITTLRYVPDDIPADDIDREIKLNSLNEELLNELQKGGEVFLSNAVIKGKYCLRACFVNFRTSEKDVDEIIDIIISEGRKINRKVTEELNYMNL